jgi:hypothetical protein
LPVLRIPGLSHQIFVLLGKVAAELRTPRLTFRSEKDFRHAAARANWPERLIEQALFLARGDWTLIEGITEAHVTIKGVVFSRDAVKQSLILPTITREQARAITNGL